MNTRIVIEVDSYMPEQATWVDWSTTVDTFKAGDPDTVLTGIAVAQQSQLPALRLAR